MSWQDCPVECAELFHERVEEFMRDYVLTMDNPIFGHVLEKSLSTNAKEGGAYMHISYCGSIHSTKPGCDAPSQGHVQENWPQMGAPACVLKTLWYAMHCRGCCNPNPIHNVLKHRCVQAARVYDLVRTKMMHVCNASCTSNGRCKRGFPRPLHPDENPSQDPETRRWRYHTEATSDQYIVPYHAICLALWRAHCAVLLICDEAWSTYVLKYVMKADCAGELDISRAILPGIMCPALDPVIAALVSAFSSTRFISPCQAAAVLAKIPLVQMPDARYVPSYPPEESSSQRFPAHASALDIYQEREDVDEELTFVAFHKKYTTNKSEAASPEVHCTIRSTAPIQCCLPCNLQYLP
jgi:hypothetical protein